MLRLDINLLFTVINLVILYFLMKKFLFGPVNAIIAKRQETADAMIADAQAKEEAAEELKKKYDASLLEIKEKEEETLEEARKQAMEEHDQILQKAGKEAEKIMEQAKEEATAKQKKMLEQSRDELTQAFLQAGEKLYMTQDDAAADAALYQQFLDKVGEE